MTGKTLDLEGEEAIQKLLQELIAKAQDLSTPLADIGEHLLSSHDDRFLAQVSPAGEPWAALDVAYAKSKRKRESRGGDKILVLDGYLSSLLRYQVGDNELQFGSDRIYAARQQEDRPFLGVSSEDGQEILDILSDYFQHY